MVLGLLQFVLAVAASLLGAFFLLRAWVYVWALSPRQPVVAMLRRATDWFVVPVSRFLRPSGNWDWPSLAGAFLLAVVTVFLERLISGVPATTNGMLIAPFALVLRWGFEMISWGAVIWVLMGWISPQHPGTYLLGILMEPFVRPVRRILPTIGRFDFSPVVVMLLANLALVVLTPLSKGYLPV